MKRKTGLKIIISMMSVVVILTVAIVFGTLGALQWRKSAQYPPPIEHPSVRGSITFAGLGGDHMGMAMWSGEGEGEIGHWVKTPLGNFRAPYFISTRDHDNIDPLSVGGMKGSEPVNGFLLFMRTLLEHGYSLSDIVITFPLFHIGEDEKGEDWIFKKGVETRYLKTDAPIFMQLKSETMIAIPVDTLIWMQDFNLASTYWETTISGMTNRVIPSDKSESSSPTVMDIAKVFLNEVGNLKVRLVIEKVDFSGTSFSGDGKIKGTFLEIHEARLEILP